MGIVIKQASSVALMNYIGFVIGFVNVSILMNRWFTPEEFGLRSVLMEISFIYVTIAQLGIFSGFVKFFPLFNRGGKNDNGLLSLGLLVSLFGFIVIGVLALVFNENIVSAFDSDTNIFSKYYWTIFPMALFLLLSNIFENYLLARSESVFPSFLRNILNRALTSVLLVLFYFEIVNFMQFIIFYTFSFAINDLIYIFYLKSRKQFFIGFNRTYLSPRLKKVMINYSLYSILTGISGVLVLRIDVLMVSRFLGFSANAIYANAVYLSLLLAIPSQAITRISKPLLSEYWSKKQIDKMDELYKKSSITQFIIGSTLFILIWANIDSFFSLQREIYSSGKLVFFLLGLTRIVNMLFGINGQILGITKLYRFDTITSIILAALTILTNAILIPLHGLLGAAFATLVSIIFYNLVRYLYVFKHLKIQPFNKDTIICVCYLVVVFLIGSFLPKIDTIFFDVVYRSCVIVVLTIGMTYFTGVSSDINTLINQKIVRFFTNKVQ